MFLKHFFLDHPNSTMMAYRFHRLRWLPAYGFLEPAGQAQGRLGPFKGGPTGNTAGIPQKVKLEAKLQWERVYDSWRVFGT